MNNNQTDRLKNLQSKTKSLGNNNRWGSEKSITWDRREREKRVSVEN